VLARHRDYAVFVVPIFRTRHRRRAVPNAPPRWHISNGPWPLRHSHRFSAGCELPDDSADGLRFSTLQGLLFAHSQYPTLAPDSVFFGPDTYRFAALISRVPYGCPSPPRAILDLGCGSGVGGIVAARRAGGRPFLALADVNPAALRLAWVNSALAEIDAASSRLIC
jgi:hypothetical protein